MRGPVSLPDGVTLAHAITHAESHFFVDHALIASYIDLLVRRAMYNGLDTIVLV